MLPILAGDDSKVAEAAVAEGVVDKAPESVGSPAEEPEEAAEASL